jgi:alpha-galactosidase
MKMLFRLGVAMLLGIALPQLVVAVAPTADEMADARRWAAAKVEGVVDAKSDLGRPTFDAEPFFSFVYDGRPSAEFLKTWKLKRIKQQRDDHCTKHTLTYTDPKTGLELRCDAVAYSDYPTAEWTLYFKNGGQTDTPIVSDVLPLDVRFANPNDTQFLVHHWVGGGPDDLQPRASIIKPNEEMRFAPAGGRPTNTNLPNYNIEIGDGGVIAVLGWPGQWASRLACDADSGLRVRGGQELTHFVLHPGEEVRTPLVIVQFYRGDWIRGQNIWRRWMLDHNLPRPGGRLPQPMLETGNTATFGYWGVTEQNQEEFISTYLANGLQFDVWWMDLGWFEINTTTYVHSALFDPAARFPKGLRPISDLVHAKGVKLMCWFETEHYYPDAVNWLCQNKPEWLLKAPPGHEKEINQGLPLGERRLFDMGNPEAVEWSVGNTLRVLGEQGIDYYRHDFNIEPLLFWRGNDAPDRQGITEIRYVTGFLRYYDELLRRKPGLLIDNCASGGQRNDIETLRRSVPLWRSDSAFDPDLMQSQTYGIAFWLPYFGSGLNRTDVYGIRSSMFPSVVVDADLRRKDLDISNLRRILNEEWRKVVAPNYYGDYYPLLPASLAQDIWVAWQFDRPDDGQGVVQAFRRKDNTDETIRVKLKGLNPNTVYRIINLDTPGATEMTGRELMEDGLAIAIKDRPGAAIVAYRKKS